jgi:hypothetical protein
MAKALQVCSFATNLRKHERTQTDSGNKVPNPGCRSGQQSPRGRKINILFSVIDFQLLTDFRLLRQIKGNSIKNCDFLKFVIYVSGGFCYC